MRTNAPWILLSVALPLAAQVRITQSPGQISVEVDGKPFTALWVGAEVAKPYLYPLRAASGTIVTRRFPLEDSPGDSKDHPHHRGLAFGHADLNGYNYWANEPFNPGKKGKIVLRKVVRLESGAKKGTIEAVFSGWTPTASRSSTTPGPSRSTRIPRCGRSMSILRRKRSRRSDSAIRTKDRSASAWPPGWKNRRRSMSPKRPTTRLGRPNRSAPG